MPLSDTVIATLVGFFSAVITSLIAARVSYHKLNRKYSVQHRVEIIERQISACETLWSMLEPISLADGGDRVVKNEQESPIVLRSNAIEFNRNITEVFFSPAGLYFSRQLRDSLFSLRDFIQDEFILKNPKDSNEFKISKKKGRKFRSKVTRLIISKRKEIGAEDLDLAKKGPVG